MRRFFITAGFILLIVACSQKPENAFQTSEYPSIFPDYVNVTIPVNIAPLNFKLTDHFSEIYVEVRGKNKVLVSESNKYADFDKIEWETLLESNVGRAIGVNVFAKSDSGWIAFNPFSVFVKKEPIDPYLVYRLIAPGYQVWSSMGIYQRSLEDFRQTEVVTNRLFPGACMNCHSFRERDHEQMMFHMRGRNGGTFITSDSGLIKINSKPDQLYSGFQYPYWHPGGRYIAFSINKTAQAFHATKGKRIEVFDSRSDIVIYDTRDNKVITDKKLMSKNWFETFPTFSPDGKSLYFCSSKATKMPAEYQDVKYNLCRIEFDPVKGELGTKVDTLVRVFDTNRSVSFPRISPNGKFLMFTLADYGNFSIWHKEADLYLLNLETGKYSPLEQVNSNDTESYHSWSSNSNWTVFSSRRVNGLYTMPYFAWIGNDGKAGKPFLLPQKDPDYYLNSFYSFNVPEFVDNNISLSVKEIEEAYNMEGIKVQ
ncbi:MAG: hypothetical protein PWQ17_939 [Anaerophaga sp.]|nr:hypothetical protein [Anaerophaga sp.]